MSRTKEIDRLTREYRNLPSVETIEGELAEDMLLEEMENLGVMEDVLEQVCGTEG